MTPYKIRTDLSKKHDGITLYRVELTADCKHGNAGQLGGWIEKRSNLTKNAQVSGNAQVSKQQECYSVTLPNKHNITLTTNHIQIGCKLLTIEEWKQYIDNIGQENGYSKTEIKAIKKILNGLLLMRKGA